MTVIRPRALTRAPGLFALPTMTVEPTVTSILEAIFAGVGVLAVLGSPFLAALARSTVHKHVADAPTVIALTDRVKATESWQSEHGEDVKDIPRMADVLTRLDKTLEGLTNMLVRAGFAKPSE